ncbi:MAG: hypothetical protein WA857_12545 [Candidatus Acidiferrum sp.]
MTVTLKIKPEFEAGLLAQAEARGMTLEEYLQSVVEGALVPSDPRGATAEERAAAFEEWAKSHLPFAPPLSDDAVSRESIYRHSER